MAGSIQVAALAVARASCAWEISRRRGACIMRGFLPATWRFRRGRWMKYDIYDCYNSGVGKCPFLGICFTSPKQISAGDEISLIVG